MDFSSNFPAIISGSISQITSKSIGSPLDVLKIRLQCQKELVTNGVLQNEYKGLLNCISRIKSEEGIKAFWKGNLTHIIKYYPSNALVFLLRDFFAQFRYRRGEVSKWKWTISNLLVGGMAGGTSLVLLYPFDYIRIRLINDIASIKNQGQAKQFNGIADVVKKTLSADGYRGLYRGMSISFIGIFAYRAIYFGLYEVGNKLLFRSSDGFVLRFLFGYTVTLSASLLSYPLETIRSRMMMRSCEKTKYKGPIDCALQIIRNEGVSRFFRGYSCQLIGSVGGALALVAYDSLRGF